jgi:hypothetical protein
MAEPYALGTFRCAYYAKDRLTGAAYVVKHFHIQRNSENDLADCRKVSKAYTFAKSCATVFQNELFRCQREYFAELVRCLSILIRKGNNPDNLANHCFDIHSITFVDSYYAQVRPFWKGSDPNSENTGIMIEPELPDFFKWQVTVSSYT